MSLFGMRYLRTILALMFSILSTLSLAESLMIRNARVFDGVSDQLSTATDILVIDGVISAIGPNLSEANDAVVLEAEGLTLMPGLIDAHTHVMLQLPVQQALTSDDYYYAYAATVAAKAYLDNGFTSIRDMSGNTFSLRQAIDAGLLTGPRIFPSGAMISQTAGHSDHRTSEAPSRLLEPNSRSAFEQRGMVVVADGVPQVLQAARENLRRGATQLKIAVGGGVSSYGDPLDVTQYTPEEIKAAVAAAEDWGTYVAAHVYNSKGIRRAADLGVRSIEHANLIDLETLSYINEKGVWLSPQVVVFQQEMVGMNAGQLAKQKQAQEGLDSLLSAANDIGYENIVFGTDIVTSLEELKNGNRELVLRTEWFEPVEVLRQATSKAGKLLALSGPRNPYGKLGVIEVDAVADILLIEGNPLDDISILTKPQENIRVIIKGGEIYKNNL